ncbi:MAG: rhomboid family intramembrane serine protease [Acidobacteria bacterium]|nr:rhomboid family intramembrane serine protease [Acidobacteriota bacterium]
MCQTCRALIPANAPRCEMCGAEGHYAARARGTESETFGLFAHWPVTTLLLTANVVIYALALLYQMQLFTQAGEAQSFSLTPYPYVNELFGSSLPNIRQTGEWWRLLASCFLHGGPIHLLFNSMALIQAGRLAEEVYGRAQYICLYVVTGVAGNYLAIMFGSRVVGASGAIFGLIAALAIYGYRHSNSALRKDMMYWLMYGLAMSFLPGISMAAHMGGAVAGAALAFVLPDQEHLRKSFTRTRLAQAFGLVAGLMILMTAVIAGRNVLGQSEARKIRSGADQVYSVWVSHLNLGTYLKLALQQAAPQSAHPNEPELAVLLKDIDQMQKALCSDIGAFERLPADDAASAQLQQRVAHHLRARCNQAGAAEAPKTEAELQASLNAYQVQDQELRQIMKEYDQWLAEKAATLHVPLERLKPQLVEKDEAPEAKR